MQNLIKLMGLGSHHATRWQPNMRQLAPLVVQDADWCTAAALKHDCSKVVEVSALWHLNRCCKLSAGSLGAVRMEVVQNVSSDAQNTLFVDTCCFQNNSGGAIISSAPSVIVQNCTFEDNYADTSGAGIYIGEPTGSATINHTTFRSNRGIYVPRHFDCETTFYPALSEPHDHEHS